MPHDGPVHDAGWSGPGGSETLDLRQGGAFYTTSWTVVLAAGQDGSETARAALERLCRLYWPPLYSYLRRTGREPETARDLTQEFFLKLLQRGSLKHADPARGRFRTFLLTALRNFLKDDWKAAQAVKRGGGQPLLSLDGMDEVQRLALEPAETDTPAKAFERRWASVVLDEAARRHQDEHARSAQTELYQRLRALQSDVEDAPGYGRVATEMGIPVGTLKSLVSRFRRRYREHIRGTIAETVVGPEEVEDEIRHLLQVFGS